MKKDKLLLCLMMYASCLYENCKKSFYPVCSLYLSLKIIQVMACGAVPAQAIRGLGK